MQFLQQEKNIELNNINQEIWKKNEELSQIIEKMNVKNIELKIAHDKLLEQNKVINIQMKENILYNIKLKENIEGLNDIIKHYESSKSWKITKPIRIISNKKC